MADTLLKKILTTLGSVVAIISLGFVGLQLSQNWDKVAAYQFTFVSLAVLLLGAIAYAGACFFLSSAWYKILSSISSHSLSVKSLRSIYARSQIAKYIPGNVMHIASRHMMLNRLGVSHKPLAVASLAEMIGLVSASVTFAIIGSALFDVWGENFKPQLIYKGLAVFAILLVLIPFIRVACLKFIPASYALLKTPRIQWALFRAYLEYLLFFALAGAILVALVFQLDGYVSANNVFAIIASFAISWLAGFITPGAPSGIGIRETILVVSLDKILLAGNGALIAILFRLVTVSGDVLFFIIAGGRK